MEKVQLVGAVPFTVSMRHNAILVPFAPAREISRLLMRVIARVKHKNRLCIGGNYAIF